MATILVVDQDQKHRALLRRALEAGNHTVIEAADGSNGIDRIADDRPDVVITEIYMPRIDGIEVLMAAKRDLPGCKVVAIAAESETFTFDALDAARLLGADRIMRKPLCSGAILSMIRQLTTSTDTAESTAFAATA